MIASGLCMMGGCFAQDAASQTVESYWPAETVDITDNESVMLESHPFPGGSSQNDVYESLLFVDLLNPPAPIVGSTIPYGYTNVKMPDNSYYQAGVYFMAYPDLDFIELRFGALLQRGPFFQGWCRVLAKEDTCTWWVDGLKYAELTASFSLDESMIRTRHLRSGQVRQFCYMAYRNAQTGISWVVSAMQSPAGLSAIWSNDTLTLTEI